MRDDLPSRKVQVRHVAAILGCALIQVNAAHSLAVARFPINASFTTSQRDGLQSVLACRHSSDVRGSRLMKCQLCGLVYNGEHACAGIIAAGSRPPGAAPEGFALGHYLGLAWRIARWDDRAVREVMNDSHAVPYGILIWSASIALPLLVIVTLARFRGHGLSLPRIIDFIGLSLISAAVYGLVHMGICHLMAKYFCAGEGRFIQIIRPLLLAEIVYLLLVIPIAGPLLVGIAWVAVMVMVFQEVHGIEPLSAFLLSAGVGLALQLVSHFVVHTRF